VIEPWGPGNLPLLEELLGDPAMMDHLGGPESPKQIASRQERYEVDPRQFRIVVDGEGVGWVGYWERHWRGGPIFEIGWSVSPRFQGRGLASAATVEALAHARAEDVVRYMHAFPSVDNGPSNRICRKVGFELLGDLEFEYPKGSFMRCNDWRYDLRA
jgi:RimJ/RimL family protein N-acetyltransferase